MWGRAPGIGVEAILGEHVLVGRNWLGKSGAGRVSRGDGHSGMGWGHGAYRPGPQPNPWSVGSICCCKLEACCHGQAYVSMVSSMNELDR